MGRLKRLLSVVVMLGVLGSSVPAGAAEVELIKWTFQQGCPDKWSQENLSWTWMDPLWAYYNWDYFGAGYFYDVRWRTGRDLHSDGTKSCYFGRSTEDSYENPYGVPRGILKSPRTLLPVAAGVLYISFDYYKETEDTMYGFVTGNDKLYFRVVDDDTNIVLQQLEMPDVVNVQGILQHVQVDVKELVGKNIRIEFEFDAVTGTDNYLKGVYVDSVRVVTDDSGLACIPTTPALLLVMDKSGSMSEPLRYPKGTAKLKSALTVKNDTNAMLKFSLWQEASDWEPYDTLALYIKDLTTNKTYLGFYSHWSLNYNNTATYNYGTGKWEFAWWDFTINIGILAGHKIEVWFEFDTLDNAANSYRGPYIDDFSVQTTTGTYSSGFGPSISQWELTSKLDDVKWQQSTTRSRSGSYSLWFGNTTNGTYGTDNPGVTKWEASIEAILTMVAANEDKVEFGLLLYPTSTQSACQVSAAHHVSLGQKCRQPDGVYTSAECFRQALYPRTPGGLTPMGLALKRAADGLLSYTTSIAATRSISSLPCMSKDEVFDYMKADCATLTVDGEPLAFRRYSGDLNCYGGYISGVTYYCGKPYFPQPYLLMVTDGIETCGGDPIEEIRWIAAAGVKTFVLGFGTGVNDEVLQQMALIGGMVADSFQTGGPAYFDTQSVGQFTANIDAIIDVTKQLEICDARDNDCDGIVDNVVYAQTCLNEVCGRIGNTFCDESGREVCEVTVAPEKCNDIDDNCDGQIDENFRVGPTALGLTCTAGQGECQTVGVYICDPNDDQNTICSAQPGTPTPEICDNRDNDCNGVIDDNLAIPCSSACGDGVQVCNSGVWGACTAPQPTTETCNGLDDDCNGTPDDPWQSVLGQPCTVGLGVCANTGVYVCNDVGDDVKCSVLPLTPPSTDDSYCDDLDNNCNGQIDENVVGKGNTCVVGVGACANTGVLICDGAGGLKCSATPKTPRPEICDGVDNDCDGVTDQLSDSSNPDAGACNKNTNPECWREVDKSGVLTWVNFCKCTQNLSGTAFICLEQ